MSGGGIAIADGSLIFDTKINESGFDAGVSSLKSKGKSAVSSIGAKLGGMASAAAKAVTVGYVAAGAAAVTAGTMALKTGMNFEASMSKVAATSGAAAEDLERLKTEAIRVASTSKFTASDAAEALNYMAMAGWKTTDMVAGLEGIMKLAEATGTDLAVTSDIVTDGLSAFNMTAEDSGHFSDVLAVASANANTNVEMMGETFKYAGTMAGALGYSVEDVAIASGLMANRSIKASQAGTSMAAIFTRLATNTNGATDALTDLGVAFFNSDGSARDLNSVMKDIRKATKNMTAEQKTNFANTVAGLEAQKGLLAILNATDEEYTQLEEAVYNCKDACKDMSKIQMNNLQGDLDIVKSQMETIGLQLYDKVGPGLRSMAQGVSGVLQSYIDTGSLDVALSKAKTLVPDLLDGLGSGFSGFNTGLAAFVTSGIEGLAQSPNLKENVSKAIGSLFDGAIDILDTGNANFGDIAGKIFGALKEAVTPEKVGRLVGELLQSGINVLDFSADAGVDLLKNLLGGFREIPAETLSDLSGSVVHLISKLLGSAGDITQTDRKSVV